jgi:nucleoside-diphosphate-sugar epimerase
VETEQLLLNHSGNIPIVALRIAGVYNDECHSIPLAHQIERIHQRQLTSHVYPGDTSCGQAFVHLDDLLDAIEKAIDRRREFVSFLPILIGEPETLSYDSLQREFAQLIHGEEWETRQIPKALAKAGAWVQDALPGDEPFIKPWMIDLADDHYALDITTARNMLGWEPDHRLLATLPKMVAALKRDAAGWYRENHLEVPSWLEGEAAARR